MSSSTLDAFITPGQQAKIKDWLEGKNHVICCDTWEATVMSSPNLMPTSLPFDTPIPISMPSITNPHLTRAERASIPYWLANDHPRFPDFLVCINQNKITRLPPGLNMATDEASPALEEASWMAYLGLRDGGTLHMYFVPSNTQDGYMTEICRGYHHPLAADKFLKPPPKATIRLKCVKHGNKLECWFLEWKEPDGGA